MMQLNWMAFAIPFFLFFIGLEYYVSKRRNNSYFHFGESIANLNAGIGERLADLFTTGLLYFLFDYIYKHYAIFEIRPTAWTWILLFLITDFLWYWYHRLAHQVNVFWIAHIVHHQSEDFNYSVSARITVFQAVVRSLFWSVMPLIGFPPEMIFIFLLIHGAYPFFTHTQTIGKLGWLEHVFVTPSHHRVHHASNPEYLDKNYGDVLIVWDKFFGTFEKETVSPVYGLVHPLKSYSFLWQHFHGFLELLSATVRAHSWKEKVRIIFGKPELIDNRIRIQLEGKLLSRKNGEPTSFLYKYISWQTGISLLLLFLTILFEHRLTSTQLLFVALFILISVINTSAILEQRRWVLYLEYTRVALVLCLINSYYYSSYIFAFLTAIVAIIGVFNRTIKNLYFQSLYKVQA
jgi:alkylglycerol monooxygenase